MIKKLLIIFIFILNIYSEIKIFPFSKVKTGMIVNSITRFNENKMKKFKLKIISILKNSSPKSGSILAIILDKEIEEYGVAQGMSGSPVYYNNKIIGAIAYTSTFQKKPIVGITPIEKMIPLINYSKKQIQNKYLNNNYSSELTPIKTPIASIGLSSDIHKFIYKLFPNENFKFVPGGSMGKEIINDNNNKFIPGDAVAIKLVDGDMVLSAIGTVTYVSSNYVLAFGHPMNSTGVANLPLCKAKIDYIVPKLDISYKIGITGKEVGSMIQDRSTAILGKLGIKSPKIPVKIKINTPINKKEFNYQITKDKNYFDQMLAIVILNSFLYYESNNEESSIFFKIKINTDYKNKSINLYDNFISINNKDNIIKVIKSFLNSSKYLIYNKFKTINIKNVSIELGLKNYINYTEIKEIKSEKKIYNPGDIVKCKVLLKPYRNKIIEKTISIKIPKNTKSGIYSFIISSEYYWLYIDSNFSPKKYIPENIDDAFKLMNMEITGKNLSIWFYSNEEGLISNGKQYPNFPKIYSDIFLKSNSTEKDIIYKFNKNTIKTKYNIYGVKIIPITIKKDIYNEK